MRLSQSIAILLLPLKAMGCGLSWSEPVSHFENVDFQGNVHIVRKLGEMEKLPIYLIFNSSFGTSPYVGSGFEIPLLESRMWQVDENRFQMKSPSGWLWIFQRTNVPNVLEGNAGWKGLIKDNSITVWAPCGDKISFKNGTIVSMQLKDKIITYNYQNGQVSEIRDGNTPILKVDKAPITGEVTGLTLANKQQIRIERGDRPRIQVVNNQQLVSGVDPSLSKITKSDGTTSTFEYAVDQKLNPTLKIGDRLITWNPATKNVISDAGWVYDIKPCEDRFVNAAIGRADAVSGKKEFWHNDQKQGTETALSQNGILSTSQWFTSGILAGRIRKVIKTEGDKTETTYRASYEENGRLLREEIGGLTKIYSYNNKIPDEFDYQTFHGGKLISSTSCRRTSSGFIEKTLDSQKKPIEERSFDSGHIVVKLLAQSSQVDIPHNP